MKCPICKADINMQMNRCGHCGQPIHVYKKVIRISNMLYNIGLERAKVRDLSGAVSALNKSLKYYKSNIHARNLLGLVYYEMGETVHALTEWILSKNICPEENDANYYIDMIQSNPAKLDSVNQTIKKYNSALASCRQGSDDLAIIQLKKVVSINPNFIKAQQLLALLYMNIGERALALKCLNAIKAIDINNTTTIRYYRELGVSPTVDVREKRTLSGTNNNTPPRKVFSGDSGVEVKSVGSYQDEKPRTFPLINVMIGVIIGLFVGIVLISPTIDSNDSDEMVNEIAEYGEKLASKESEINSLKYDKDNLAKQVEELEKQLKEAGEDNTLPKAEVYATIIGAYKKYVDGDVASALAALNGIDMSVVDNDTVKEVVSIIMSQDSEVASADIFEKGRVAYNSGKYEEALEYLEEALALNKNNYDAIYFLGRLYHKQGDKAKAEDYYRKVINDFPDSDRAREAKQRLGELGVSVDSE